MVKNISAFLITLTFSAFLMSCDFGDLKITARFNNISNLKSGDRIIYQEEYIGDVETIRRSGSDQYLVELDIDSGHKKNLTDYSIFYIDDDPDNSGRKAVITEQEKEGGIALVSGSIVVGSDHPPFLKKMLEEIGQQAREIGKELTNNLSMQLNKSLAEIERKMLQLEKSIRTVPDSDEVKELKKVLDNLTSDLERALERARTVISVDFFNSLKKSLADLRKRLEDVDRELRPSPAPVEDESIKI